MSTLAISKERVKSPNVRRISRYRRFPEAQIIEVPNRKKGGVISRLKFWTVIVLASFLLVVMVNEGLRTWLQYSNKPVASSKDFIVPRASTPVVSGISQVVQYQIKPADQLGMVREQNRYRVDMTREANRFASDLLSSAERITSRLSR